MVLCCSGAEQSVVSAVSDASDQQMTDAQLTVIDQLDSEPMIVDACPVQTSMEHVVPAGSDMHLSEYTAVSSVSATTPPVPTDVNFNSSSNHVYVSDHTDVTSSLCRPALSHWAAAAVVDSNSPDHDTLSAKLISHRDAVSTATDDDDVHSNDDAISTDNAVPADDKLLSSHPHGVITDSSHSVMSASEVDVDDRYHAGVTDDVDSFLNQSTAAGDRDICTSLHTTDSARVAALSDIRVVCSGDAVVTAGDVVVRSQSDGGPADAEECTGSHVNNLHFDADDIISAASHNSLTSPDNVDSAAVFTKTNSQLLEQDMYVDDDGDQLSPQQHNVDALDPDVMLPSDIEHYTSTSEARYSEVWLEGVTVYTEPAGDVLSDVTSSRLSLPHQLTSEVAASEDIYNTHVDHVSNHSEELNRDVKIPTEVVLQTEIEDVAMETVLQQDAAADDQHLVVDEGENDTKVQHSTKSPTSKCRLCLLPGR